MASCFLSVFTKQFHLYLLLLLLLLFIIIIIIIVFIKHPAVRQGWDKLVYRLIVMFLSTEIFSKRRKIYSWIEEKPELTKLAGPQYFTGGGNN